MEFAQRNISNKKTLGRKMTPDTIFPYFIAGMITYLVGILSFVHFYDKHLDKKYAVEDLRNWMGEGEGED